MRRYGLWTALVAAVSLGASLLGGGHRRAALTGSCIASATAVASLLLMDRAARSASAKPVKSAVAVMAIMFLLRILLVGLATALVYKAGDNVFAFVIAFFVPYFIFSAIEGAFVHSLGRETGPTA